MNKEMMKGSIDLILMSVISQKDMYGYEIVQVLKQSSEDDYSMSEGTLYPALKRLETQGAVQSYWVEQENGRPRKYYRITDAGKLSLKEKLTDWTKLNTLVMKWNERGIVYD